MQDCLRALGTGRAASPPDASAPQASPPAQHLGKEFPLKEEVVAHDICNPTTTLAPDTPEWQLLKYVFRRACCIWMKKHRQEDKDGVRSYRW